MKYAITLMLAVCLVALAQQPAPFVLHDGTPLRLRLGRTLTFR